MTLLGDRATLHDRLQRIPFYLNLFVALEKVQIVQVSVACTLRVVFVTDAQDFPMREILVTQPRYFKI